MTEQVKPKSGAPSRERLLEAAVDVFGKHGFEAATTRMIAREAGVNLAAIPYYFSGKEGLYHAAVAHIVEKIETKAGATFRKMASLASEAELSPKAALDGMEALLEAVVNFMVGSPEAARVARIILREQLDPSSAYDIIFKRVMTPVIDAIAGFTAAVSGADSYRTAKLRAMAIMGQIMAFRVARETAVRSMGLVGYSPEETEKIRSIVLEHTRAIIASLSPPNLPSGNCDQG